MSVVFLEGLVRIAACCDYESNDECTEGELCEEIYRKHSTPTV